MAYGSVLTDEQDSTEKRKNRGAFFTPSELSDAMCSWAIRSKADRILEPSFGEGRFLFSAAERLRSLAGNEELRSAGLCGFELHAESVEAARILLHDKGIEASLACGDFLVQKPERLFDAVIGNPPYVRFQSLSASQKAKYRKQAETEGVALSGLASLWAPFLVHSVQFLKKNGRIAFVLPAELLSVNYAAPIRSFLLDSFSSITIETFNERVFPEVQEEVVLLYAEGYGLGPSSSISWRQCNGLEDIGKASVSAYRPDAASNRWSGLFAPQDALVSLSELETAGALCPLSDWATINLGVVTGANAFFAMSDQTFSDNDLTEDDVVPLCPPGSKHLLTFDVSDGVLRSWRDQGLKAKLFYPRADRSLSDQALSYIELGEKLGLDKRYKCSKRTPWWRVPLGKTADAFLTYMNAYSPRVCSNSAGTINLNSVHGLYFNDELRDAGMRLLPVAFFNSATLLSSEVSGRSYGGGVLKVEPGEAQGLLVPSPGLLASCEAKLLEFSARAESLMRERQYEALVRSVDQILFGDSSLITAYELENVYQGHVGLRERRRLRAKEA